MSADKDFYEAVKRMRQLQKDYFRTRDAQALSDAKRSEREVDAIITARDNVYQGAGVQGRLI